MADFLPNKPNNNVKADDWVFKEWFMQVWRYFRGENAVAPIQLVTFTADLETFLYPCATGGGAIVANLPPAAGNLGKKYCFRKTGGIAALTITPVGSDTINGAATLVVVGGTSETIISDGVSSWYSI